MKEYLKKVTDLIKTVRSGDRILVDGDINVATTVYRRSKKDDPYLNVDYKGGFSITLIEIILIVSAVAVVLTLLAVGIKNKIVSRIKRK